MVGYVADWQQETRSLSYALLKPFSTANISMYSLKQENNRKVLADGRIGIPGMFGHLCQVGMRRAVDPLWIREC